MLESFECCESHWCRHEGLTECTCFSWGFNNANSLESSSYHAESFSRVWGLWNRFTCLKRKSFNSFHTSYQIKFSQCFALLFLCRAFFAFFPVGHALLWLSGTLIRSVAWSEPVGMYRKSAFLWVYIICKNLLNLRELGTEHIALPVIYSSL